MSFFTYLGSYFETNHFTLYLFLTVLIVSTLKYLKIQPVLRGKKLLFLILLLGLLLRLWWIGFSPHEPKSSWNPAGDQEWDIINTHAAELTKGIWFRDIHGEPMARRPIGYPMLLGLCYKIFGVHRAVAQGLHLSLYLLCGLLVFLIARLTFGEGTAMITAFLFAVFPTSIYSIVLTYDEHLFLPLWYFGLYLLLREIHGSPVRWSWLWYGVIFGYATMTRTHTVFMPLVVGFAYFLMKKSWRKIGLVIISVFFIMQLLNLPWLIRNYRAWGVPIVYTMSGGYVYAAFNSYATPEGGARFPARGEEGYSEELQRALDSHNGPRASFISNQLVKKWMFQHPLKYISLGSKRLLVFMRWHRTGVWPLWFQFYEGSYDPARPVPPKLKWLFEELAYSFYYGVFFCFLAGAVYWARQSKNISAACKNSALVLASCIFFWLGEHTIIFPDQKYRFPLEPLMMMWGAYFLNYLMFKFRWEKLRSA